MGSHQQTTKMGEGSKQVRVDNWGIFFLQRLQMFFNKTDYCDLTLQFEGNVQLKVHRLVMNACTEYFHVLEQTCEMVDDTLIMPADLQADVVLPIVNFMYTGMLEFRMSIFDKLYKTANLMNITVLTKLLDAQKTPIAPLPKSVNKRASQVPHTWNLQGKKISAKTTDPDLPAPLPGRKLPVWKRKSAPAAVPHTVVQHFYPEQKRTTQIDPLAGFDNTPKPTRFEWPEEELSTLNLFDSTFDDISYTSKPLLTQDDEPRPSTSFDRIKETPDTNRRPATYSNSAVDIDDVKDYVKEQRIRSNLTEEDDDDDETISNDFANKEESLKRKIKFDNTPAKRVRFNVNEKENQIKQTKINITPTGKTTSADVEHTKIISELLKKYPNLVKKNKNIRLKILAKSNNTPMVSPVEQNRKPVYKKNSPRLQTVATTPTSKIIKVATNEEKNEEDGSWKCQRCSTPSDPVEFVLYYLYRKHMTDVHNEKFDSRMCKFCGHKSSKHNMLMYHQYTKHGVKPPPAYKFPKCSQCPYIALTEALLLRHKMNHTKYELQCVECKVTFTNQVALTSHIQITGHTGKSEKPNYDCQYCTKKFPSNSILFSHIRMQHRDEARRDGIVSIDEVEEADEDDNEQDEASNEEQDEYNAEIITDKKEKIKILSDVKLPSMDVHQSSGSNALTQQNITLEPSSEAEALSNVASGIATSLGLVDVVVLDENQQYILHTDNQQGIASGESEFILPDLQDPQTFTTTQQVITSEQNVITQSMLHNSDIGSTDELVMVLTDHDYGDGNNEIINNENSNIVVLYSHPIEGQENQFITSQGNLMLTSQAGLIELRNGNAVVTSASPHFITTSADTSDSSHIESIEMIQREINQHPNQIHLVEDIKPALVQQVSDTADAVSVPTAIKAFPQHLTVQPTSDSVDNLHGQENAQFNTLQDILPSDQNSVDQDVQETSEVQEGNETEANEEQVVADNSDVMEQEPSNNAEATQQENEVNTQVQEEQPENEENANVSNATDEAECTKTTEESNQSENFSENVDKEPDQENTSQVEEISQQSTEQPPKENTVEIVPQGQETSELDNDNEGTNTQEETSIDIQESLKKEETPKNNESEKCEELCESLPPPEQSNQSNDTSMDDDTSHITGDLHLNESGKLSELTETEELPNTILESEVDKLSKNTEAKETSISIIESVSNLEDESSKVDDEITQSQDDNEKTPQQDESFQSTDENSKLEENDDNSHLSDVNSQLQDENSRTSQTSQASTSNRPIYSRNNSNQSAKIILDDWEDTDSQQSDSKNGTTVNKLIDDWDDDEEDNKKGAG